MRFFSFDCNASSYHSYALAQCIFAKKLAQKLANQQFYSIAELGCGSGVLLEYLLKSQVEFREYDACDISEKMLKNFIFQKEGVSKICKDFDDFLFENKKHYSLICSSSALQWAKNFDKTLRLIAQKCDEVALSIVDSYTFTSLHSFLGTSSPLLDYEEIQKSLLKYFEGDFQISRVDLRFQSPHKTLLHLRKSGVMGGGVLNFAQSKKLLLYDGGLEYESVIFIGKPRKKEKN
ncbi:methyltransferase domain-containing protein [Helicobacter cholecystus]|uniref:Methyltransferase domain-containing protein n=1 Tax=Helicobacter cholecystus TaxID=45498 RepID=A0A3D8IXT6_9HELI|nr:methyltransferase [Helicobacter cholecystus]RDU69434.1 methyltransferase domain-containing protein [Helicobacter cholecystus]VEJ23982.1 biotin synthesis protein BioC [Helicobacter cholecystus]